MDTPAPSNPELEKAVTELWESLSRGGGHWSKDVIIDPKEKGFVVVFLLEDELPKPAKKPLSKYAHAFLRERGWRAFCKFGPRYFRIELSRA